MVIAQCTQLLLFAALFNAVSSNRPRADVCYCLHTLSKRLTKTRTWQVWSNYTMLFVSFTLLQCIEYFLPMAVSFTILVFIVLRRRISCRSYACKYFEVQSSYVLFYWQALILCFQVALKALIVIHRAMREVDVSFLQELVNYTAHRDHLLNLTHFKDDTSTNGTYRLSFWLIICK